MSPPITAQPWWSVRPDHFGPSFPFVIVVACTTTDRGLSLNHQLEPNEQNGLDVMTFAQCEQVRSINRRRLVHRLGAIDPLDAERVHEIVQMLLGR